MHIAEHGPAGGPALLLLHGGGVAGWMWDAVRAELDPGIRVLVPDLPGHGASADTDYRSHAATVEALVALVAQRTPGGVTVAGFSLGAQLAILLAAHPEVPVRGAAVVSAQARPLPGTRATLALLGLTAGLARKEWFARLQARELFIPESQFDDYVATSRAISRATLLTSVGENLRFRLPDGWARFDGPSRVLVGSRERRLMRDSAELIRAAAPHARLEVVEGAGHGLPLQRPALLAATLADLVG